MSSHPSIPTLVVRDTNVFILLHSKIFRHLQCTLRGENGENGTDLGTDDNRNSSPRGNSGVSIEDKMRMWTTKEDATESDDISVCDVDEADLDDFHEADIPYSSDYRETLAKTLAYQWLQSSIRAKNALQVPGPGSTSCHVGDQIVTAVTAVGGGMISRKHTRDLRMRFTIDWNPFLFLEEQEYDHPLDFVLARAITLTGYGNSLQATTCEGYMKQTWPETGPPLLAFLQQTMQHESGTYAGK